MDTAPASRNFGISFHEFLFLRFLSSKDAIGFFAEGTMAEVNREAAKHGGRKIFWPVT